MPIYASKCSKCETIKEEFRSFKDYDKRPECCGVQMDVYFTPPMVMEDMKEYISPLDGTRVKSRSDHRKHMLNHGVIEVGNEKLTKPFRKKYEAKGIKEDLSRTIQQARNA